MLESVKNNNVKVGYQNEKSYLDKITSSDSYGDTSFIYSQFLDSNSNDLYLMTQAYLNNNNSGIIQ